MGWSLTSAASKTMGRLETACRGVSGGCQNRFPAGKDWFYWEHDTVEYDDGRVTGVVYREVGAGAQAYAHFEIEPGGRLVLGHKWMHDALKGA